VKNRFTWSLVAVAALCAGAAFAAAVDGKWTAQVPGFDGSSIDLTFTFKAEGDKLSGSVSTPMGEQAISEGKISSDEISFRTVFEAPDGGFKMTINYKGKIAGDEIKMTQTFAGGPEGGPFGDMPPVEYVAKRAK